MLAWVYLWETVCGCCLSRLATPFSPRRSSLDVSQEKISEELSEGRSEGTRGAKMLGKRPRQIRRTTSMSELGPGLAFPEHLAERQTPPSARASNPQEVATVEAKAVSNNQNPALFAFGPQKVALPADGGGQDRQIGSPQALPGNELFDATFGANVDASSGQCGMMQNGSTMMCIENMPVAQQSMAIGHVNQSCILSPPSRPSEGPSKMSPQASQWPHQPGASHHVSQVSSVHGRPQSVPPNNFLDVCCFCKRRLGPGRDIFMYRGDRAFCSIECRHHQIVTDERREKCSVTATKKVGGGGGATPTSTVNNSSKVVTAETAAAG